MPAVPTPPVNGHVLSSRLLHASRSLSSFTPAATIDGAIGFTATAGSFCLFCANVVGGLVFVTSVSEKYGVAAARPDATARTMATPATVPITFLIGSPFGCCPPRSSGDPSRRSGSRSRCSAHKDELCAARSGLRRGRPRHPALVAHGE